MGWQIRLGCSAPLSFSLPPPWGLTCRPLSCAADTRFGASGNWNDGSLPGENQNQSPRLSLRGPLLPRKRGFNPQGTSGSKVEGP
jgi:hypothetical protein